MALNHLLTCESLVE